MRLKFLTDSKFFNSSLVEIFFAVSHIYWLRKQRVCYSLLNCRFVNMTSRNVRSLFFTSMHDRSAFSHIDLTNLMYVRCIKRLTSNSRHICVFRSNRRKCQYCHDQRHKCFFVDLCLRWACDALLNVLDFAIFLKYDFDAQERRRSSDRRELDQSTHNSRVAVSSEIVYETNWDRRTSASRVWSHSR
jgi:hypothetical protein